MTIQFQARHQAEVFESMAATSPEVSVADFAARDLAGLLKALADRADEAALATVDLDAVLDALRQVEWSGAGGWLTRGFCPVCGGRCPSRVDPWGAPSGHKPDCILASALASARDRRPNPSD